MMNMPPPVSHRSYDRHVAEVSRVVSAVVDREMKQAATRLQEHLRSLDDDLGDGPLDITVSADGTWATRGYTSLHGLVFVISQDTGEILDFTLLSRHCPTCNYHRRILDDEEFARWKDQHEEECQANYTSSSKSMESAGCLMLWTRSVSRNQLRYTAFVGDGDSAAYKTVLNEQPYGPDVQIVKKDCVGHVQKRMGTGLRNLVASYKGQKLSDGKGIGGMGRLTKKKMDSFQVYYGKAIKENKGNAKEAQKAVKAILQHSVSTNESHAMSIARRENHLGVAGKERKRKEHSSITTKLPCLKQWLMLYGHFLIALVSQSCWRVQ